MPTNTHGVPVKYIGREDPFYDRLYGSSLPFSPGQVRVITDLDLVAKFLRHSDCFERVVVEPVVPIAAPVAAPAAASTGEPPTGQVPPLEDDTEAKLNDAAKLRDQQEQAERHRLDLVDTVNGMDKESLQHFALEQFSQKVPKTLSVENMRTKVVELIDQFGVP
ncbi:hypothetical protein GmRootV118_17780 [Variovorax sp. V118]|uniref:hypothetical protein n=1 Tax=Variovorax sp. V118 TaxID=3065954 RepID=UPI0034E890E6